MKIAFTSLVGAAAVASMLVAAGTAQASDDTKCHATIAKSISKYQAGVAKGIVGCHKSRTGGKFDNPALVDCNDTDSTGSGADQKGKRTDNRTKAITKIVDTCTGTLTTEPLYVACPSPKSASDDGGATTGIDDYTELATCLLDISEHYLNVIGERTMGSPNAANIVASTLSEASVDCQGAIGKALSKFIKTVGGARTKCHATVEKGTDTVGDYTTACSVTDTSGKIAPALAALDAAVATCTDISQYDEMGFCLANYQDNIQQRSPAKLQDCAVDEVANPLANGLAGATLELDGTYEAIADVTITAANGDVKIDSSTRLDSGWKGTAHQIDVIDQSLGAVNISGCDADGRNCDVTHNARKNNCRCQTTIPASVPAEAANLVECSTINGVDPACGGGICQCMFGPPLAISASSTPVCVVNRFAEDFDGLTGELGEYDVATTTRALVHTGLSQTQPCPICVGDATPNSNDNAGGVCDGGPRNGLACDENAEHPDFGPSSFDCPPSTGANISGSGLLLALQFESGTSAITAGIPEAGSFCGGAGSGGDCHCSVCSGDNKVGCTTNSDCTGFGTCGVALANNPSQNNCDTSCTPEVDGSGTCDGPILSYCSGFLNGFGNPVITCSVDGDCDSNDCNGDNMNTPGECGTCSAGSFVKCFPPTVTATGSPGIFESTGVSVFCSGQTGNSGVDNAGGLPGPGRVKLDFDFDLFCPTGGARFQLPGGSNCP
jgi:hypothetical protein